MVKKYTSFIGANLYKRYLEDETLRGIILDVLNRDFETREDRTHYEVYNVVSPYLDFVNIDIKVDDTIRLVSNIFIDVITPHTPLMRAEAALRLFFLMDGDDIIVYECVKDGEIPNLVKTIFYDIRNLKGGDCVAA